MGCFCLIDVYVCRIPHVQWDDCVEWLYLYSGAGSYSIVQAALEFTMWLRLALIL